MGSSASCSAPRDLREQLVAPGDIARGAGGDPLWHGVDQCKSRPLCRTVQWCGLSGKRGRGLRQRADTRRVQITRSARRARHLLEAVVHVGQAVLFRGERTRQVALLSNQLLLRGELLAEDRLELTARSFSGLC